MLDEMTDRDREHHLCTLRLYYDIPTLKAWIEKYKHARGKKQREQVARWRRVLRTLEENSENA